MKIYLLSAILLLGFFLRAQETLSGNFLFLKDQGRDMLAVKSVVVDKKPTLIGPYTGFRGVFQGPLYYYILALPFVVSGGDPRGVMWLMLTASMLSIPFGYIVGKKFFSETTGLFTAFLFAVSPAAGAAATFIWSPFFIFPLVSAWLYFFLDWVSSFSKKSFVIMVSFLGLMFHFETAFAAPFTLTIFIFCYFLARKNKHSFSVLLFFVILAIFLSPLLLFDFRHDHITLKSIVSILQGMDVGLGGGEPYGKIVRDHIIRFILNLKATFIAQDLVANIFSFVFLFSAVYYMIAGLSKKIKLLVLIPLVLFTIYLFFPYQIWDWYVIGLFPIYLLLGGIFLTNRRWRLMSMIVVIVLLSNAYVKLDNLYRYPDHGGTAKLRGKLEAIDAVYKDANGQPFSLEVFTPVVLTDAYDYLIWWYGLKKYSYTPEDRGMLYLLIESDPSKPWSYNGWIETEIKIGSTIDTYELPSGFIIQKRKI